MANNEKTLYEIPCPFSLCNFCDDKVIEVRAYKGNEKCGVYGYAKCGAIIRPPKIMAKKILAKHSENLHSENSTMQIDKEPKTDKTIDTTCKEPKPVHSANSTIQIPSKEPEKEQDFFSMMGGG